MNLSIPFSSTTLFSTPKCNPLIGKQVAIAGIDDLGRHYLNGESQLNTYRSCKCIFRSHTCILRWP